MRRAILPLTVSLALATGFALSETRLVALAPVVPLDGSLRPNPYAEVIGQFYADVNETIGTGDPELLTGVVDRDYVDHASLPGVSPDRDGLISYLTSLHRTAPTIRLIVLDVLAQDDRVAARVRLDGGDDATFLGLPIATDRFWSGFDIFRLASGRVVEHWADETGSAFFDPIVGVMAPVANPTRKAVTLQRWTYAPDTAERGSTSLGFAVLVIDGGTLTLELDVRSPTAVQVIPRVVGVGPSETLVEPGSVVRLDVGDALVLPDSALYELRNDDSTPAVALAVTALAPVPAVGPGAGLAVAPRSAGVTRTVLAGGLSANLPRGEVRIAIGRATFAPWTILPAHAVGVAELIAVEAGELAVTTAGGTTWASTGPADGARRADSASLPAGGGALVGTEATVVYRNATAAPLGVLLVTIGPLAAEPQMKVLTLMRQDGR